MIGLDGILGPDGPASLMAVTLYSYSLLAVTFVSSNSGTFTGVLKDKKKDFSIFYYLKSYNIFFFPICYKIRYKLLL